MKRLANKIRTQLNMSNCFIMCTIISLTITFITLFLSHGDLWSKIFFHDSLDTGMDFFHSIEYTRGRSPYELYNTLYPPLANLLFYVLFRLVPLEQARQWADTFSEGIVARGSFTDLRIWQPTMMLFILFIMLTTALLIYIVKKATLNETYSHWLSLCVLLSYGVLYSLERGNIIILCVICCLFFICYKDSTNKWMAEFALITLAISAGLKLYPAVFGLLLLYDKQYKKAIRTIIYGIACFILPFFVFREGINGLPIFLDVLTNHTSELYLTTRGFSIDKIINSVAFIFIKLINWDVPFYVLEQLLVWGTKLNILAIIPAICGFFVPKRWQKILSCSLTILLYQSQGVYILSFLTIPFLFMIAEEHTFSRKNIIPYVALLFSQLVLPITEGEDALMQLSVKYGRFQLCISVLLVYLIIHAFVSPNKASNQKA
ncbi:MAG: DUF2029 domain-containing protein [Lachnospiraceae bacterium]|nr:DUF2029 domain-containing protein [Lachnospiraceae bacterium]